MRYVIVPTYVSDAINHKLDAAYKDHPAAMIDREIHYHALLAYFDEHGEMPEFALQKNLEAA